jgi:hypothetical protein
VTLTKPEHDCPTQFIRVGVGVTLVWDPAIFTVPFGGVGVGVTTKVSAVGVLSPAMYVGGNVGIVPGTGPVPGDATEHPHAPTRITTKRHATNPNLYIFLIYLL